MKKFIQLMQENKEDYFVLYGLLQGLNQMLTYKLSRLPRVVTERKESTQSLYEVIAIKIQIKQIIDRYIDTHYDAESNWSLNAACGGVLTKIDDLLIRVLGNKTGLVFDDGIICEKDEHVEIREKLVKHGIIK